MSVVLPLRGVTALSDFRVEKLFQKAAALGLPEVKLSSEFWYFVGSEKALDAATVEKLQALLAAQSVEQTPKAREGLHLFLVTPRFGHHFLLGLPKQPISPKTAVWKALSVSNAAWLYGSKARLPTGKNNNGQHCCTTA